MADDQDDPLGKNQAVGEDGSGRLHVDLTRRHVLGALAGTVATGLGYRAAAADQETVGGDKIVAGGSYTVPSHTFQQDGTLRELYVAVRREHIPDVKTPPSLAYTLFDGPRLAPGTGGESSTSGVRTNLAELHVAETYSGVTVNNAPALIVTRESPALRVVVDGESHQRSGLGGGTEQVNAAPTLDDLPSSPPTPTLECAKDGGTRVNV